MNATRFVELRARVQREVARICPRWLAGHRDDIVQQAMVRLMAVVDREGEAVVLNTTYLRKVAHCSLVSEIRRLRPDREQPLAEGEDQRTPDRRADDPARALAGRQLGAAIGAAMDRLSTDRRRAVALYLEGHGVSEAARLLGWGAKRTENLVHRGLRDLRADLTERGVRP